jgi:hypothetical protein
MTQELDRDQVREGTAPAIPLSPDKETLKAFYSGQRLPSPLGGHLELLAVREGDDGAGRAIFECSTSSLRFELVIKKATRTEKQKAKEAQADGSDPTCPRHGSERRLTRLGSDWFCPQCGVRYGRAS